jgi:transposase
MARGKLKRKIPQLQQALAGRVRDHRRFLIAEYLDEWEALDERIRRMEAEIDKRIRPFETAVTLWQTIPGVERVTACSLVAELGVNMNQFPSAQHLASWAALCPGNHESAGKRSRAGPATVTSGCDALCARPLGPSPARSIVTSPPSSDAWPLGGERNER